MNDNYIVINGKRSELTEVMLKAAMPEIQIVVDSSCCAGTTPKMHKEALDVMKSCQIDII